MSPDDPIAQKRSHDPGQNAALLIDPNADPNMIATWAVMMNRGLCTMDQIRDQVMQARAVPR